MSDLVNALNQQSRSSGVLDAIAHPNVVNPLAAMSDAAKVANTVYQVRQNQANQAIGDILQQSTDANGNVDYGKAQALASQAGPVVQMGMQTMLKNNSELRNAQLINAANHQKLLGVSAMTIAKDGSDANVNAVFDNMAASGVPQSEVDRERARWLAMSPQDRQTNAVRVGMSSLDQLHQVVGQTTGINTGGQYQAVTVTQPGAVGQPGSITTGPGSVPTTLSPGETVNLPSFQYTDPKTGRAVTVPGPDVVKLYGYGVLLPPGAQGHVDLPPGWQQVSGGGGAGTGGGVVGSDGKPVGPNNPPRLLNTPGGSNQGGGQGGGGSPAPAQPSGPPAPPGAPAGASSSPYTGGGIGAVLSPGGGGRAAPAPPAAGGGRSDLGGGVPVASANGSAPNVGPASPPSPAVAGDVSAIMAGINQRQAAGRTPGTQTAAAYTFGPTAEETEGFKTSAAKLASDDLAAANFQSTQFPYVQALKNYGEGTKTGPTTDFWNQVAGTIRTPLAKIGVNIGGLSDTTERVDALGKWLASIQSSNPVSSRSDAELAQVLKGSATTHINEVAGEDMVKAGLALQRMNVAANREWHQMSPQDQAQYGTYLRFLGSYNNNIDPRAFMVDTLNPAQVARLRDQLSKGSEADAQRFESSLALARRNGMVSGAGSQAMP